ncbi:MAG: LysM peptidoglycan-binding domain-containing protein [Anaerolineales bacterium]|nr:LysM peptidoglycan-binding domain-containing protein [Anaerolineales bacterium]
MSPTRQLWCVPAIAVFLVGCTVSYSNPPTGSPKSDGASALSTNSVATMNALRTAFIQQTAQAQGMSGTPYGGPTNTTSYSTVAVTPTEESPSGGGNTPAATPTVVTQAPTAGIAATSTPGLPATYKIHEGETIWCLGRRFDIDPVDIIAANNGVEEVYPDDVIKIPQDGDPFPGERALVPHSPNMAHTVQNPYDTVWKIGCYYGDVDPNRIIAANGLKEPYTLAIGQRIIIP